MIKKIALPLNFDEFCRPFLPFADDDLHIFYAFRKGTYEMDVIWHQQRKVHVPIAVFVSGSAAFYADGAARRPYLDSFFALFLGEFDRDEVAAT